MMTLRTRSPTSDAGRRPDGLSHRLPAHRVDRVFSAAGRSTRA